MNKIRIAVVFAFCMLDFFSSCDDGSPASNSGTQVMTLSSVSGQELFEAKCSACHGMDGTAGIANAANLQLSRIDSNVIFKTISEGKSGMPSFKDILTEIEIHKIANYVYTLRR
jgi:mono/diheme cytochrome c family protein